LLQQSIAYWHSRGFNVDAVANVELNPSDRVRSAKTNPIYAIGSHSVMDAIDKLGDLPLDAIVLLGTGMPSLNTILQKPSVGGAPVFSCTLALAWRCVSAMQGSELSANSIREWIAGDHWRSRFGDCFLQSADT
jgi:maleate isomerase